MRMLKKHSHVKARIGKVLGHLSRLFVRPNTLVCDFTFILREYVRIAIRSECPGHPGPKFVSHYVDGRTEFSGARSTKKQQPCWLVSNHVYLPLEFHFAEQNLTKNLSC